jgi:hypothetical protein
LAQVPGRLALGGDARSMGARAGGGQKFEGAGG